MKKSTETPEQRLFDLKVYEKVGREISENNLHPGVLTKALVESDGNEEKARARYIELRVQMIKDEFAVGSKRTTERSISDEERDKAIEEALKRAAQAQKSGFSKPR